MSESEGTGPYARRKGSIEQRASKVHLDGFAAFPNDFSWYEQLRSMIPKILRGKDLDDLSEAVVSARERGRPVILMMGAHLVKCGLGGLVCGLLQRKMVTRLAVNGACAIHDVEIAMWGETSEDVGEGLKSGMFGATEETARFFNAAAARCLEQDTGFGDGLGAALLAAKAPHQGVSILSTAQRLGLPVTVHVAIGTDVVHQHAEADGKAIGHATMKDFRSFSSAIMDLRGGVVINIGSAVIMPEVFLKGLAIARNAGVDLGEFTTANFDMIPLYRPITNVVERPRLVGARSYSFLGNHEIVLPVFVASVMSRTRP
jgi:hypothetical protein